MAGISPPADLLDRAGHVFMLAHQLGRAFQDEQTRESGKVVDPACWDSHQPAFEEFSKAILNLKEPIQDPPAGFDGVADALRKAASVARIIRDLVQTAEGRTWAEYRDSFPDLNSAAVEGMRALKEASSAIKADDPFDFVDQRATKTELAIDTTPMFPKPPQAEIDAAEREIPKILSALPRNLDGTVELVASTLAKRVENAKHLYAAAQWAIHSSVRAGRLLAGVVIEDLPGIGIPNSGPGPALLWKGGGKGRKMIPKDKPTPFDCFKVIATDSLWKWWNSPDAAASKDATGATGIAAFIEGLLAGPDNIELGPREMAMLEAKIKQSCRPSDIQREKKKTGRSQILDDRSKLNLILNYNLALQRNARFPTVPAATNVAEPMATAEPHSKTKKQKRSTSSGEGQTKLIAALTKHHHYAEGGSLNLEPIGNNALAEAAGVSTSTASDFFKKKFKGYSKYQVVCRDGGRLVDSLKALNEEFAPHDLYDLRPHNEEGRDE